MIELKIPILSNPVSDMLLVVCPKKDKYLPKYFVKMSLIIIKKALNVLF